MLPLALVLNFFLQSPAQPQTAYVCGDRDAQTPPLRNTAGFSASLTMHSEDDHGKNSHQCQADYALHVIRPDGTPVPAGSESSGFLSSDADWNRPLVFRIDGFSPDGKRVFVFVAEGGQYSFLQTEELDTATGSRLREEGADRSFLERLGTACAATLHISGTTANGHIVVETRSSRGCSRADAWQLNPNRRIKGSLASGYGIPARLASGVHIVPLDPGTPVPLPRD